MLFITIFGFAQGILATGGNGYKRKTTNKKALEQDISYTVFFLQKKRWEFLPSHLSKC